MNFAKRLSALRFDHGWTQHELAAHAGIRQSKVSALERGSPLPTLVTLQKLQRGFACSWDALLGAP